MSIVNDTSFSFNKQFKYNFNGGELSSDGGLFLLKEFANRIGFEKVIRDKFQMILSILLDTFNSNKFMRRSLDSNNTAYA